MRPWAVAWLGAVAAACAPAAERIPPERLSISARDAWLEARTVAVDWADDAVLRYVEGEGISAQGYAVPDRGLWRFVYDAPGRADQLAVTVRPRALDRVVRPRQSPPGLVLGDAALGEDWIDSPPALEAVRAAAGAPVGDAAPLSMLLAPLRPARWIVRVAVGDTVRQVERRRTDRPGHESMKIAVLFGGETAEREVSIASGAQVVGALRAAGHDVVAVDTATGVLGPEEERVLLAAGVKPVPPEHEARDLLRTGDPTALTRAPELEGVDLIFLALHGGDGEGGALQTMLELTGIPYTGSGPLASGIAMDKDVSKRLLRDAGVATPPWLMAPATAKEVADQVGFPVVVKPSKQGSSVGLTVVREPDGLDAAVELAFRYDDEVMIERFITGRELTVPILGDETLPVGEIIPRHEIFDYECKYQPGMADEVFPADISEAQSLAVQELAMRAHIALKLRNYSRIDFRMDESGGLWCLEANTLPGMTANSLFPRGARAAGMSFPETCDRICRIALQEHEKRRRG